MQLSNVRVRFAPSPTGPLHIGGLRTALYNYLFAKKHGGKFILRIEDTDQTRFVPGAEQYIIEALKWCGVVPDEGQSFGGEYGPYKQSERKEIYIKYVAQLIADGKAYYAFDTSEELEALRTNVEQNGSTFSYGIANRMNMNNSLALSKDKVENLIKSDVHHVVRFKVPENETVHFVDAIRGEVVVNSSTLDDKILFKSDGLPTYHLANIVDDYLMKTTHVIRGEEWLPSCPFHVLLYKALGWEKNTPTFAHLPLLLKPIGQGKLSKRDGDKLGFPVFPLKWIDPKSNEVSSGYREEGYIPQAFVNMLALLGWNPGTEQEIFTLEELAKAFSLERVSKSGARFNKEKAVWFNHQYLQATDDKVICYQFIKELEKKGISVEESKALKVVPLIKHRVNFVSEMVEQSKYFFKTPSVYDEKTVQKRWKDGVWDIISEIVPILKSVEKFEATSIQSAFSEFMNQKAYNFGLVMNGLRLAIVGDGTGADLFQIMEIVGKDEVVKRLSKAIQELPKN